MPLTTPPDQLDSRPVPFLPLLFSAVLATTPAPSIPLQEGAALPDGSAVAAPIQVAKAKIIDVPSVFSTRVALERERLLEEFPDSLVEKLWLQDWLDIERATQFGRLVEVKSDPEGFGIVLRLDGASRIGELEDDDLKQRILCRLARPAAGLLYRIAWRLRLIEGESYEPLEVTSLVRTWDYQLRLTEVNSNADRTREGVPPTHVLGLAFDLARSRMSKERQTRLESVLGEFADNGELAYYKEGAGNDTYHVIALPSAAEDLTRYYEKVTGDAQKRVVANARHRYVPDSPCVMFGSALEPYSAICSCEMPVEASAVTAALPPTP